MPSDILAAPLGDRMEPSSLSAVELIVRAIAETAVANEKRFGDLDAVVGDGDFGYSLARGFEKVLADWDSFDRSSIGAFLRKIGLVIASRVGGTSGPIWGTAFLRAGAAAGNRTVLKREDVVAILRAAVEGIMQRGGATLGEKTLLDSLVPAIDRLETELARAPEKNGVEALSMAAQTAEAAAAATTNMMAKRGRASYAGERSIGSPDAGAVAIGVIASHLSQVWRGYAQRGAEDL
jgi:phosphoenolpyruvate---glycerone phosphotransferase subunit DhaL